MLEGKHFKGGGDVTALTVTDRYGPLRASLTLVT
jgi:hypothetical protein